jgi:hypothetical protein
MPVPVIDEVDDVLIERFGKFSHHVMAAWFMTFIFTLGFFADRMSYAARPCCTVGAGSFAGQINASCLPRYNLEDEPSVLMIVSRSVRECRRRRLGLNRVKQIHPRRKLGQQDNQSLIYTNELTMFRQ